MNDTKHEDQEKILVEKKQSYGEDTNELIEYYEKIGESAQAVADSYKKVTEAITEDNDKNLLEAIRMATVAEIAFDSLVYDT